MKNTLKQTDNNKVYTRRKYSIDHIRQVINDLPCGLRFVDPFGGNGSYVDACKVFGIECDGYDIEPGREDIIQKSIFDWDRNDYDICITNPPFTKGYHFKMLKELDRLKFKYILYFCPSSILKTSSLRKIPKYYHIIKTVDYPSRKGKLYFETDHKECPMNMTLILLERRDNVRIDKHYTGPDYVNQYLVQDRVFGKPVDQTSYKYQYLGGKCGEFKEIKPNETYPRNVYHYFRSDTPSWIIQSLTQWDGEPYKSMTVFASQKSLSISEINEYLHSVKPR